MQFKRAQKHLVLLILLATLLPTTGFGEEIEEAIPLEDAPSSESPTSPSEAGAFRYRGYLLLGALQSQKDSGANADKKVPVADLSLSADYDFHERARGLIDIQNTYDGKDTSCSQLNQIGVSMKFENQWQVFAGKDRSKKSPGLIVSPSDFLHSNESLPGNTEVRNGVWNARLANVSSRYSYDLIYVPALKNNRQGLPERDRNDHAVGLRSFFQTNKFDIGLNAIRFNENGIEESRFGGFLEFFVNAHTKIYLDRGQTQNYVKEVYGVSYDAISDLSFRIELYKNGAGYSREAWRQLLPKLRLLNKGMTDQAFDPFVGTDYLIASVQFLNLWREATLTVTNIEAIEEPSRVTSISYSLPMSAHQTITMTAKRIASPDDGRFALRNFDTEVFGYWKYSL